MTGFDPADLADRQALSIPGTIPRHRGLEVRAYVHQQNFHVAHRLDRYRAGRRIDYATTDPDAIAAEIGRTVDYRPVETDGAARAASLIAGLL